MKFEDFKNIIKDLTEKGYLYSEAYNKHIFVEIKKQDDKELENILREKIDNLWSLVEGYKGHSIKRNHNKRGYIGEVFVSTNDIVNAIRNEKTYENMKEALENEKLSDVSIDGIGIDKKLCIIPQNTNFEMNRHNRQGYEYEENMAEAIKQSFPDTIHIVRGMRRYSVYIQTDKAKEWEQKKINCKEIQISNDFDEILSKYNIKER